MQHVKTAHPPGTIILAAGAQPRYWEFNASMEKLVVPEGTRYFIERSCDVTGNFNDGMKKLEGEWAWFLGDDHQFHEHTLMKFLAHNVDVVVPISPMKIAPWAPCVMHGPTDGRIWHDDMPLYTWDELSGEGLLALPQGDFIGQAGMLVRRKVLDEIGYPWFKCGQLNPGRLQEDMTFCRELQARGYTIWIDQDVIFDHWFIVGVTARKHDGQWVPALKSGHSTVVLPDAKGIKDLAMGEGVPRVTWRVPREEDYAKTEQPIG